MDSNRFDSFTKSFASELSRRSILRRGGLTAAALLATGRLEPAPAQAAAQPIGDTAYTVVRRYELSGPPGPIVQALQSGYLQDICNADGFQTYVALGADRNVLVTVAIFDTQDHFQAFANAEAAWVAQYLATVLPAPTESISGETAVHVSNAGRIRNTCPGVTPPPPPTVGPAPTTGPAPTAAVTPTATLPAPCTSESCVCATSTQAPCDDGLVCCPTTGLPGGPGVCQIEDVCFPDPLCLADGDQCTADCAPGTACSECCSGFCGANDRCQDAPAPCTTEGCTCATGTQAPCDDGLICCGSTDLMGGPGTCLTEAECPCGGEGCACNGGVLNTCDNGLVCCQEGQPTPGGAGVCTTDAACAPAPCTEEGCDCNGGVQNACDAGLVCCQQGESIPGGPGVCTAEASCAPPPCTGEGCDCNGGVLGACDAGLVCCQQGQSIPGGAGICTAESACAPPPCTGQGCECATGTLAPCDDGLICCGAGGPAGAPDTCQPEEVCNPPATCVDDGGAGTDQCPPDSQCTACCSGYCEADGTCGLEPTVPLCIADGDDCTTSCASGTDCPPCCNGFCGVDGHLRRGAAGSNVPEHRRCLPR